MARAHPPDGRLRDGRGRATDLLERLLPERAAKPLEPELRGSEPVTVRLSQW
ncbi:hypothetical protein [Jiangella alkaliphila]|uniref:hypothetical protein n=1 Tax=Jiangella alkaliphila TaxID=419479 RepID=UPI0012F8ACA0|nr:hypothetical protein [Jiangella alkaliphila]